MPRDIALTTTQIDALRNAEVIFVAQDGYSLAPARIRAYNFATACRDEGMRAEVLSFYDHLGSSFQGSGVFSRMEDTEKLTLILKASEVLSLNSTAVFYCQKVNYHTIACAIASGRNGNRLIIDYDDLDFSCPLFPKLERFLTGLNGIASTQSLMKAADMCVVSSHKLMELVQPLNRNTHLIPTVTDLSLFDCRLRDSVPRNSNNLVQILWLGDIWGQPIVDDLMLAVHSFALLPHNCRRLARFNIVGFGDCWVAFKRLIHEKYTGINELVLSERIAPADAPALLAQTDIGCLPLANTTFNQCKSPTKMFEYMAMKVAICGTPVGEINKIHADGISAMLAQDVGGYRQRLAALITDVVLRRKMAELAYRKVLDGLHLGAVSGQLIRLIRTLHSQGSRDPFDRNR